MKPVSPGSVQVPVSDAGPASSATRTGLAALGRGPLLLVVIAAVVPRLPHLGAAIVGWHSWRQADTAAIARNFYRDGMNLLYPAVDWAGAGPGYVESEFPLFPYLAAVLYRVLGPDVVWGRALAIVFATGAALYLARLASRHVDRWSAACAAVAFSLFPINTYIGAAFMPESLMLLASVAAIDHMDLWARTGRERDRWLSALFLATAVAVKLPELFLGVPVAYLAWSRLGWRAFARPAVWLQAVVALALPGLWYLHAHRLKEMTGLTFKIWEAGRDKWGNLDLLMSPSFYTDLVFSNLIERHLAYAGVALLVAGIVRLRRRADLTLFRWWVGGAVLYVLVVAKGNAVHDYYQLPVLLPLSLWVGAAIAWPFRAGARTGMRVGGSLLVAAFVVLSAVKNHHFYRKEVAGHGIVEAGRAIREVVPEGRLVIVMDDGNPTLLYHVDRRGWLAGLGSITEEWVDARRRDGAAYLVAPAGRFTGAAGAEALDMLRRRHVDRSTRDDYYVFELGE